MGLRGVGAKQRLDRLDGVELREVLPWEVDGLSRVDRVVAFLEDLPITQGKLAGTKLKIRPWQREFLEAVYGEDEEGNRPVRTAVLSVARKNGKTGLIAGLALCHLCGPESEMRGEVYAAANDRSQAGKTFNEMCAIVIQHPELDARLNIVKFRKEIEVMEGDGFGSLFSALSADAATKHGLSPSFVVYDELGQAPKRDLYEALDTAMGARDDPLMCVISTQAADDHAILSELIDYGLKVNAGDIVDPSFHLTFYTSDPAADPWHPETWVKANPALGDFRSLEDVQRQAQQAELIPSKENAFRNLILNQRVEMHERFINRQEWDACNGALSELNGHKAFGGLDLSGGRDLTALVWVFPGDRGGFDVLPRFFLPADGIAEKSEADRTPYDVWARDGLIELIPGSTIDPGYVADAIAEDSQRYDIQCIAFDQWRINDLKRELGDAADLLNLEPFAQSFKHMSPAVDTLERAFAEKQIRHGGNPVLSMCAANTVVARDNAGNRKLDKGKSRGRIDGVVALAMALSVAQRFEPENTTPQWMRELGVGE